MDVPLPNKKSDLRRFIGLIPFLHHYIRKPFHAFTDASKYGIGGMLAQTGKAGRMHHIAYCSKVFTDTQMRWHVSEQQLYAAIYCVEKGINLLRYQKFTLHTDHKNLQTLFNKSAIFSPSGPISPNKLFQNAPSSTVDGSSQNGAFNCTPFEWNRY